MQRFGVGNEDIPQMNNIQPALAFGMTSTGPFFVNSDGRTLCCLCRESMIILKMIVQDLCLRASSGQPGCRALPRATALDASG